MKKAVKKQVVTIDPVYKTIMEAVRVLDNTKGVKNFTIENVCQKAGINQEIFYKYIDDENDMISKVLDFERESFKVIFDEYDFEGINAIDILLTVSKEMSRNYKNINPSVSFGLKTYFPGLYQEHVQKRIDFIFMKIKIDRNNCYGLN